jgi:protein-S-isoprenylcysteine O-methyltransferase Ste14
LFLARLSAARDQAGEQPGLPAQEAGIKQGARSTGDPDSAQERLAYALSQGTGVDPQARGEAGDPVATGFDKLTERGTAKWKRSVTNLGDRPIRLARPVQSELIPSVLLLRALISFLVLPGTFAGLLPAWIVASDRARGEAWIAGAVPLAFGMMVLLWCVRDFYVAGRGTLAPWDPPRHLVIVGLYRFTRNPMYVGVLLLLVGWSLLAGSPRLSGYTVILAIAFHLRVVLYEEPTLAKTFGEEWSHYAATVPRWLRPLPRPER